MEKVVKARKEHTCSHCNHKIMPGQMYNLYKTRHPKYESDSHGFNERQVGIEYFCVKEHVLCTEQWHKELEMEYEQMKKDYPPLEDTEL